MLVLCLEDVIVPMIYCIEFEVHTMIGEPHNLLHAVINTFIQKHSTITPL